MRLPPFFEDLDHQVVLLDYIRLSTITGKSETGDINGNRL